MMVEIDLNKRAEDIKIDEEKVQLGEVYEEMIEIFKEYCDIPEEIIKLMAIWIIGGVNIKNFKTYPYLFVNAMKGSGKTRVLKLIMRLCGGDVVNSITEAVLFRTNNPLGLDEFEGVGKRGKENVKELLNSAYKRDTKVKRMRKVKTKDGEKQVVEEFDVYRPIVMANIWGMEDVLGDRCIKIVIDKSNNPAIIKKIERFEEYSPMECRLCRVVSLFKVYNDIEKGWNSYIKDKYNSSNVLNSSNNSNIYIYNNISNDINYLNFYNKVDESDLGGRILELSFPLLFIAYMLNEDEFNGLLNTLKKIEKERKEDDMVENSDVSLIDFVSQEYETGYISLNSLVKRFKEFIQLDDEWINNKWLGRALKRLNLIKEKRRNNCGREVILDIPKAQEKIKMFK